MLVSLQGVPALVFAPHVMPLHSSGKGGYFALFSTALLKALQKSLNIFLNSGVLILLEIKKYPPYRCLWLNRNTQPSKSDRLYSAQVSIRAFPSLFPFQPLGLAFLVIRSSN